MTFDEKMKVVIGNNLINIKKFLKNKNIENSNIDNLFSRVKVVLDKEKDIWIEHYLNEAITEYINQLIIKDKYSDYYNLYI